MQHIQPSSQPHHLGALPFRVLCDRVGYREATALLKPTDNSVITTKATPATPPSPYTFPNHLTRGSTMRKVLLILGIAVLCLPMLFVTWLLLASRWQKMDATTAHAPLYLRQTVASVILQNASHSKNPSPALVRTLRLDPDNPAAWHYRCTLSARPDTSPNLKDCETAVKLNHTPGDYYLLGRAQELSGGDPCVAEETFTHAVTATSSNPQPAYLDGMARTALRCGDISASRVGFEVASQHAKNGSPNLSGAKTTLSRSERTSSPIRNLSSSSTTASTKTP